MPDETGDYKAIFGNFLSGLAATTTAAYQQKLTGGTPTAQNPNPSPPPSTAAPSLTDLSGWKKWAFVGAVLLAIVLIFKPRA